MARPLAARYEPFSGPIPPVDRIRAALVGVLLLSAGIVVRVLLDNALMSRATFIFFVPPIIVGALLGGARPGLFLTLLGAGAGILCDYILGQLVLGTYVAAGVFLVIGAVVGIGGGRLHRARLSEMAISRELKDREAQLSSILQTVPDAMIVIDEQGCVLDFSSTAERQFGWSAEEVIGRNVKMLMPSPYRENHDGFLRHYRETGERRLIGIGGVVTGERKDGSTFPMELAVGEIQLVEGRVFTGFVRDLTERHQTETRLQELQSELVHVARLTALGEMASALAHELNQPLSAIGNYLMGSKALLRRAEVPQERVAEAVDKAGREALRAGEIIRRLRDFVSRGETERRVESLPKLIEDASALALVGAQEIGVRTRYELDPEVDLVLVDKVQVQQVLLNLVRNAVDAMVNSPDRQVTIQLSPAADEMARVTITDTGPGIDPEVRQQLFRPFVTTKRTGMGVGLSICRTIIEAHGGRIWAEGSDAGGATFHFTVPRVGAESAHDGE